MKVWPTHSFPQIGGGHLTHSCCFLLHCVIYPSIPISFSQETQMLSLTPLFCLSFLTKGWLGSEYHPFGLQCLRLHYTAGSNHISSNTCNRWASWGRHLTLQRICLVASGDPALALPCNLREGLAPKPWLRKDQSPAEIKTQSAISVEPGLLLHYHKMKKLYIKPQWVGDCSWSSHHRKEKRSSDVGCLYYHSHLTHISSPLSLFF